MLARRSDDEASERQECEKGEGRGESEDELWPEGDKPDRQRKEKRQEK